MTHGTHTGRAPHPFDLPAATHSYLERAAGSLREAMTTQEVPLRYACAHVAALRATAALLAARATPVPAPRRSRQKNAWVLLAEVAPEFRVGGAFFAAGAAMRRAAAAGSSGAVPVGVPDDLVRDADRFLGLVEESLGMTRHVPLEATMTTMTGTTGTTGPVRRDAAGGRAGRRDHVA